MDIIKKNLIAVTAGAFIFIFVPLAIFGARFVVSMTQEKVNEARSIRIDQEINLDFLQSVVDLRRQQDTIVAQRDSMDVLLADDANQKVQVFTRIEEIARSTGHSAFTYTLKKKSPKPKPKKKSDEKSDENEPQERRINPVDEDYSIVLVMQMTGTYQNLMDFIIKLENFDYENDITQIALTARDDTRTSAEARRFGDIRQNTEADADDRTNLIDSELTIAIYLDNLLESKKDDFSDSDSESDDKNEDESEA